MNLAQAKKLIKLARESISTYFDGNEVEVSDALKKEFRGVKRVIVSLFNGDLLVGSAGIPEPDKPLYENVVTLARAAAFEDPRTKPLSQKDFKNISIEISILSKPVRMTDAGKIKIGKHGLMIVDKFGNDSLPPYVAVEWNWDSHAFLEKLSLKAALGPNAWKRRKVFTFTADTFREVNGNVKQWKGVPDSAIKRREGLKVPKP